MQSTSSEAQITQAGQAIAINAMTCSQLSALFSPLFGPHSSAKVLVGGGLQLNLVRDGYTVCKEVPFSHPTSILITRGATSLYRTVGDGSTLFVLVCTESFLNAYQMYSEGTTIPLIVNSMQLALQDTMNYLQSQLIPLDDALLRQLALSSLSTKGHKYSYLAESLIQALVAMSASKSFDPDMLEVIRMGGGDITDSKFVDGLVFDHSGRHYAMPKKMENVCVLASTISLEYEKPEINAEFCYSSPEQREKLAESEREFILERARAIADFALKLKAEGRSLLFVTEKGIDPLSLEVLSQAGVLALRRAKRRNLERLVMMCGGKVITQISQVVKESLGYCQKVSVHSFGENKFTIIEGTPMKGSCTMLIRGFSDSEQVVKAIKSALISLFLAVRSKACIRGGIGLYKRIIEHLREKMRNVHEKDTFGYVVFEKTFEKLIKTLITNSGKNVYSEMARVFRSDYREDFVVENAKVVGSVINNAIATAISLLMCDEIIKAGRPIKEDKTEK